MIVGDRQLASAMSMPRSYSAGDSSHMTASGPRDSRPAVAMRERLRHDCLTNLSPAPAGNVRLTGLAGLAEFVGKADPEIAGNAMICAIHQAVFLLKRQIESQGRQFLSEGGFTENLYRQRQRTRRKQRSDTSDTSGAGSGSDDLPPGRGV